MIPLDRIKACSNPRCRAVLPADPENPREAGFTVIRRENGRVAKFEGRCKDCVRRRRRRTRRATRSNNPVYDGWRDGPVKLKVCRGPCGLEKICADGPESEFAIHKRREGYALVWNPICKACKNAEHKRRLAEDAEFAERVRSENRRRNREWLGDEENRERARRASRKYHRKLKEKDPERLREYARMGYVLRKEREGKSVRERATVIDGTQPRFPAERFREWLSAYAEVANLRGAEAIAKDLQLVDRHVRGIFAREYSRVAIDRVSRALTNARYVVYLDRKMIVTIEDLYGDYLRDHPGALK